MIESRGVELDELHVLDGSFRAIDHSYAVACRYERIGGCGIDGTYTSGSDKRNPRKEFIDFTR